MIVLVGIAHVLNLKSEVERIIFSEDPEIVAVELDYGRYLALTQQKEGKMPYIYRKMAEMQREIARMMGTSVGDEMVTAIEVARLLNKKLAFIDMDAMDIIKAIKKNMSLAEKLKIYLSFLFSPIIGRKLSKSDIEDVVQREEEYIARMREKYPGLSRALFDLREEHMAKNLKKLEEHGKVVAFVGDAHIPGLKMRLENPKVIRLRDLVGDTRSFSVKISIN